MNQFVGTRISIVEDGHVLWHNGKPWRIRDDYPVVVGDVTYTTEEGYHDTLKTLGYMRRVGSRYVH